MTRHPSILPVLFLSACTTYGGVLYDSEFSLWDDSEPGHSGDSGYEPPPPPSHLGTGADGPLLVEDGVELTDFVSEGREHPDIVVYKVDAIDGALITLEDPADGLAAGDEVLIMNLRGSSSAHSAVGRYAFASLEEADELEVTLAYELETVFGEESNEDLDGQKLVLQRVPQYTEVTVRAGAKLQVEDWRGSSGGVLALRATGTVLLEKGAAIDVDGVGYQGGEAGWSSGYDGYQGESYGGYGVGGSTGSSYNESIAGYESNFGGGGCNITGGGGNYGGGATPGDSWDGGGYTAPQPGNAYGMPNLSEIFFGSGGGGVWSDGTHNPDAGGDGGGILFISAQAIEAQGGEALRAKGEEAYGWAQGSYSYGAAGGAGGSIFLMADEVQLAPSSVLAPGGEGQDATVRVGGNGGYGRIRIDCEICNGHKQGSDEAQQALIEAAEPDPGHSEALP